MISALTEIPFDNLPLKPPKVKKEVQIPLVSSRVDI